MVSKRRNESEEEYLIRRRAYDRNRMPKRRITTILWRKNTIKGIKYAQKHGLEKLRRERLSKNPNTVKTDKKHQLVKRCWRRSLGFHKISNEHKNCVWHHVNRNDVVAVPGLIHQSFQHSLAAGLALKIEGILG